MPEEFQPRRVSNRPSIASLGSFATQNINHTATYNPRLTKVSASFNVIGLSDTHKEQ